MSQLQCPIDHVKVNENKVRLIALIILVIGVTYLLTNYWPIVAFLLFDFSMRALNQLGFSLAGRIADIAIKILNIPAKPTDRGPKRFAAGMGLALTIVILIVALLHWQVAANMMMALLCVFAFLEAFTGFCMGCYVYSGLQKFSFIK